MLFIVDVVKKKTKRVGITEEDARNCEILEDESLWWPLKGAVERKRFKSFIFLFMFSSQKLTYWFNDAKVSPIVSIIISVRNWQILIIQCQNSKTYFTQICKTKTNKKKLSRLKNEAKEEKSLH